MPQGHLEMVVLGGQMEELCLPMSGGSKTQNSDLTLKESVTHSRIALLAMNDVSWCHQTLAKLIREWESSCLLPPLLHRELPGVGILSLSYLTFQTPASGTWLPHQSAALASNMDLAMPWSAISSLMRQPPVSWIFSSWGVYMVRSKKQINKKPKQTKKPKHVCFFLKKKS